jgi:hypothetical protein
VRRRGYIYIERVVEKALSKEARPKDIRDIKAITRDIEEIVRAWKDRKGFRRWVYTLLTSKPLYYLGYVED